MATRPANVSDRWIEGRKRDLRSTVPEINGQPNPAYVALQTEISEGEADRQRWKAFAQWLMANHSAGPNEYHVRHLGKRCEPGTVFIAVVDGKQTIWTFDEAWGRYEAAKAASAK